MKQALHIFKKDAYHLRWEIALVLVMVATFAVADAGSPTDSMLVGGAQWIQILRLLVGLSWFILIARVIHSEALPGDKQFWLTRPYSWKSLLAAKTLFLLAFFTLPMAIADAVIVSAHGFSIVSYLPGFLWLQVLRWGMIVLPIAALASVTSSFTSLLLWSVALIAGGLGFSAALQGLASPQSSMDWVRGSTESSLSLAVIGAVVVWQYAQRRTVAARTVYGCVIALSTLAPMLPWGSVFSLQARPSLTIGMDSRLQPVTRPSPWVPGVIQAEFPVQVAGVPEGLRVRTDLSQMRIEDREGRTVWRSNRTSNTDRSQVQEVGDVFWLQLSMRHDNYDRLKGEPLRIRTSLYLTLYGNPKSYALQPDTKAVDIHGVGLCDTEIPQLFFRCQSPFRGARLLVVSPTGPIEPSYSPFPAEMGISPLTHLYARSGSQVGQVPVTLITEEPIEHLRRDLTFDNVRLADFETPAPPR